MFQITKDERTSVLQILIFLWIAKKLAFVLLQIIAQYACKNKIFHKTMMIPFVNEDKIIVNIREAIFKMKNLVWLYQFPENPWYYYFR